METRAYFPAVCLARVVFLVDGRFFVVEIIMTGGIAFLIRLVFCTVEVLIAGLVFYCGYLLYVYID